MFFVPLRYIYIHIYAIFNKMMTNCYMKLIIITMLDLHQMILLCIKNLNHEMNINFITHHNNYKVGYNICTIFNKRNGQQLKY